jgi:hypothetical protein
MTRFVRDDKAEAPVLPCRAGAFFGNPGGTTPGRARREPLGRPV